MTNGRLLLLDSASLYFRAFFGVPDSVKAPDGTPVNAVRGLLDMIARLVQDRRPTRLVACWDDDWRPAFRVEAIPSYKAHRVAQDVPGGSDVEEVPELLRPQLPFLRPRAEDQARQQVGEPAEQDSRDEEDALDPEKRLPDEEGDLPRPPHGEQLRRDDVRAITSICAQCHVRFGKSRSTGLPYANNFIAGDNLFQDFAADFAKVDDANLLGQSPQPAGQFAEHPLQRPRRKRTRVMACRPIGQRVGLDGSRPILPGDFQSQACPAANQVEQLLVELRK